MNLKFFPTIASLLLLTGAAFAADTPTTEENFVSLFDGKSFDGWKVGENAALFQVRDGMIVMDSPAHLFYVGDVNRHEFKNFDLRVDVMTFPCANSGIYLHTKYQPAGWPGFGLECQVNNSHSDWRRTGSLWGIRDVNWGTEVPPADTKETVSRLADAPVKDNVWFTQEIICVNGVVTVKLNGQTLFEYKVADADAEHTLPNGGKWLPRGTFALQGHPPMEGQISKVCFKNIRVKVLPD